MPTTYAIFETKHAARRAQQWLRQHLSADARISVVAAPERLSHHVVPLRMTEARRGAFQGGAVIAMVVALVSGLVLFGLTRVGVEPLLPAVPTWLLCTALGALLGALAGGLAFSSQSNAPLQRLHAHLHRRRSIVLVEGPLAAIHDLQRFAPMRVGVLA